MKKNIIAIMLLLVITFGGLCLSGCTTTGSEEGELKIYTSFYPIYDLTKKVVGNSAEVINLVPVGEDAHHYELTPKQMVGLETADLIIINGLDMEHWADDLSANILSKILVASYNIAAIDIEIELGSTREDPHTWTSIKNAKIMMENIKNEVVSLNSDNAQVYENNYAKYAILFDGLDYQYEQAVTSFTSTTFIVSHKAFGYIARDCGLTQMAIGGLETDGEADPATVADIIDFINDNNITTVFYQESINSSIAVAIANETGASVDMLSTVQGLSKAQIDAGEDYLSIMAQNLVALIKALS